MSGPIDAGELSQRVRDRRDELGMSLRAAAEDSGVPFNTLSRVEKGHLPDLANFGRLVTWVGLDPTAFFRATPRVRTDNTPAAVRQTLRNDPHLTERAAAQIAELVDQLYHNLAAPTGDVALHLRADTTFTPAAASLVDELMDDLQKALLADDALGVEPGWS